MIDATTEVSTAELCAIVDLTKGRLSQLENAGIIKHSGRDRWPLIATVRALLKQAQERSVAFSEAKAKLENLKVEREKLRLAKEAHDLAPVAETTASLSQFAMWVVAELESMPAAIFSGRNDRKLRRELEQWVFGSRTRLADRCHAEAESLEKTGKAAVLAWGKDKGGEAA
jgi:hypothetical protein